MIDNLIFRTARKALEEVLRMMEFTEWLIKHKKNIKKVSYTEWKKRFCRDKKTRPRPHLVNANRRQKKYRMD